jgi:hypothetical protein
MFFKARAGDPKRFSQFRFLALPPTKWSEFRPPVLVLWKSILLVPGLFSPSEGPIALKPPGLGAPKTRFNHAPCHNGATTVPPSPTDVTPFVAC